MKVYEGIEAALAEIDSPEKWCQGNMFVGDRACAVAAFEKVMRRVLVPQARSVALTIRQGLEIQFKKKALDGGRELLGALAVEHLPMAWHGQPLPHALAAFNDTHSHPEVVALFQAGIREAKRREAEHLPMPDAVPFRPPGFVYFTPKPCATITVPATYAYKQELAIV